MLGSMLQDFQKKNLLCEWCAAPFVRRSGVGRIPHYCRRTCRQRAYEHRRRGASWPNHPTAPPSIGPHRPYVNRPPRYECGNSTTGKHHELIRHGVRPYTPVDATGKRPTLCGASVRATRSEFMSLDELACRTCAKIADKFPPRHGIDPSADLGNFISLFEHHRAAAAKVATSDDDETTDGNATQLLGTLYRYVFDLSGIGDDRLPPARRAA